MIKIIEGAINCYAKCGIEGATMDQIAKTSGVSRPLLFHYFENKEELFRLAIKRICLNIQQMIVDRMQSTTTPIERIKVYVAAHFEWAEAYPNHARVWILYLFSCSMSRENFNLHTELMETGHQRIMAILQSGIDQKLFTEGNLQWRAKQMQFLVSGAIIASITEDSCFTVNKLKKMTIESCARIAQQTF